MVTASLARARSSIWASLTTFLSKVSETYGSHALIAPLRFPESTPSTGLKIFGQPLRQQTSRDIAASRFSFFVARKLT